ncbi:MAG: heavy metal-associated domain-containing protein [Verrucomicrobiota bacterium]
MKKTIGLILAILTAGVMTAMAGGGERAKTLKLTVDGMVCAGCAGSISGKLAERDEVEDVYVSLESKLVAVGLKEGVQVSDDEAKAMVKEAGYKVTKVERTSETLDVVREDVEKAES